MDSSRRGIGGLRAFLLPGHAWVAALVAAGAGSAWLARHWLLLWAVALTLQVFAVVPMCWHATRRMDVRLGSVALAMAIAVGGFGGMGY